MREFSKRITNLPAGKRELLNALLQNEGVDVSPLPIQPRPRLAAAPPLSFAQQRMWFLDQLTPDDPFYNMTSAFRLTGPLNLTALEQAFNEIFRRHEVLRTTFASENGQPVQRIAPVLNVSLSVEDLRELPETERESQVYRRAMAESQRTFDLSSGSLMHAGLLKLGNKEHILLYTMHHIISDGWTLGILQRELAVLYNSFCRDLPSPLPDLPIQYADFAQWQREWLQGQVLESQLQYWRQQLDPLPPVLRLPTDRPRPAVQTFHGKRYLFAVPQQTTEALRALSQRHDCTMFMVLLAAFQLLMHRYTGQDDIAVGTPIANRNRREIEDLIGFFANSLVLRTHLPGNPTFEALLTSVRDMTLGAYANQDVPFEMLVEMLQPKRDLSHNPLFQVIFAMQNAPLPPLDLRGLDLQPLELDIETTRFDLELHLWDHPEGLSGFLLYNTELFNTGTASRLTENFLALLEGIATHPESQLTDLPLLSEVSEPPQAIRIDGRRIPLPEIEAALLQHPSVEDCAVRLRHPSNADAMLAVYIVAAVPLAHQNASGILAEQLQPLLPEIALPIVYTPLTRLPLTPAGDIDDDALLKLEVIDTALLQRWEEALQAMPQIERAAVVVQPVTDSVHPLHLSDLLPSASMPRTEYDADVPATQEQPEIAQDMSYAPLALSDGGPLVIETNAPKTLTEALQRTVAKHGDDKGIYYAHADGTNTIRTYAQLFAEAKCILSGLTQMGLKPKDAAILQIDWLPDYFATFWACVLGGIIPVTVAVPPMYEADHSVVTKLFHIWKLLDGPPILASDHLVEPLAQLEQTRHMDGLRIGPAGDLRQVEPARHIHNGKPHDVVFYQLTSGSTGVSKCIQETHHSIISHIHGSAQHNGYTSGNVSLNWLLMDHVVPILTFHLKDVYLGCQQIQAQNEMILANPLAWLDLIEAHRVTHTWSPNFGYKMVSNALKKAPERTWDLSSMQYFMNAGEQVTAPVVGEFLSAVAPFGIRPDAMQPGYGMAEMCTCMVYGNGFSLETHVHNLLKTSLPGELQTTGTAGADTVSFVDHGPPMPGVKIRIADAQNQVMTENRIGRLQVKGDVVTQGYLNNPEANLEAFAGDGWFNTGDLGFIRDGRLTITGREKEMIIIRGVHYYCYDIEEVVNGVADVQPTYVGACGIADPNTGMEELAIFFTPVHATVDEHILTIKAIQAEVALRLGVSAAYVIPVPMPQFPKTTSGKIQRSQLKLWLEEGHFQETLKTLDVHMGVHTLPDWFYQRRWQQKRLREGRCVKRPSNVEPPLTVVFLGSQGLGRALVEHITAEDGSCAVVEPSPDFAQHHATHYSINPAKAEHYAHLFSLITNHHGQRIDRILHLWTHTDHRSEIASLEQLEASQSTGLYSLLFTVQALAQCQGEQAPANLDTPPELSANVTTCQLYVISSHAQLTSPKDRIDYEKSTITGLLKSIPLDLPWLQCRHIDCDLYTSNAEAIMHELQLPKGEPEVAYRQGQRLVPALRKVDMLQSETQPIPIENGGLYLVTGGLGGIGVHLSEYLLKTYGAKLLIVGKTNLPERSAWDQLRTADTHVASRINHHLTLEAAGGEFMYAAADVCDLASLQRLAAEAETRWDTPLAGIMHLAGEGNLASHWTAVGEHSVASESESTFHNMFRAKVYGTWALYQLLRDRPKALFVAFSSVNSVFGAATFGAYAASNSFLDAYTLHHHHHDHRQSYSFNWTMWDDIGMSHGNPAYARDVTRTMGYHIISKNEGLNSLMAGLCRHQPQLIIGLDANSRHMRRQLDTASYQAQQLCAYITTQNTAPELHNTLSDLDIRDRFGAASRCDAVQLPSMPLTNAGEIDRAALLAIGQTAQQSTHGRSARRQQVAPQTDLERTIAAIWGEALQIEVVSTTDNFFELGGHSLLLTQVHNKLRHVLAHNLAIVDLFQYPTISALAKHLSQVQDAHQPSYAAMHDRAAKRREALDRQRQTRRNRGTGPRP